MKDLKTEHKAPTEEIALIQLDEFEENGEASIQPM